MGGKATRTHYIGKRKMASGRASERIRRTSSNPSDLAEDLGLSIEAGLSLFIRAKEAEQVRRSTIRNYIDHISYLTDYLTEIKGIAQPMLSDLSAKVIRDYTHYLLYDRLRYQNEEGRQDKTRGLSPHTVNMRLRTFRTMSRFWASEGVIKADFMQGVQNVLVDEASEIRGLSDGEIDLLLNSFDLSQFADYRDSVLVYLLLDTGLRINEAVRLTIERIDFDRLSVHVPSQVAKNRRNREVPISPEVAKMIRELYEESIGYFGESETVFFNAYGDPFTADAFRKRLNRRKKRLGMERLSPHMFRHTFGRNYLLNGGDIATLQRILDHADIETTRKYATVDNEDLRAQHNRYSPVRRILKRR